MSSAALWLMERTWAAVQVRGDTAKESSSNAASAARGSPGGGDGSSVGLGSFGRRRMCLWCGPPAREEK